VMDPPQTATFTAPDRVPVPFGRLRFTTEENQTMLEWSTGGILQVADQPGGPWTNVGLGPGRPIFMLPSPFPCIGNNPPQRFYRVRWE